MGAKEVVEVIGILIALLTLIFQFMPDPHDFTISVDPVKVDIEQDDIAYTSVEVDPGLLYNKDVNLRAESVSSSIRIFFDPVALEHGSKSASRICILAENGTLFGEHLITIVGSGSDGKNHSCILNLKVHSIDWSRIALTPAATPFEITDPKEGSSVSSTSTVSGHGALPDSQVSVYVMDKYSQKWLVGTAYPTKDGDWACSNVEIGQFGNQYAGQSFTIFAICTRDNISKETPHVNVIRS